MTSRPMTFSGTFRYWLTPAVRLYDQTVTTTPTRRLRGRNASMPVLARSTAISPSASTLGSGKSKHKQHPIHKDGIAQCKASCTLPTTLPAGRERVGGEFTPVVVGKALYTLNCSITPPFVAHQCDRFPSTGRQTAKSSTTGSIPAPARRWFP